MPTQTISIPELQACAILYTTKNSVLFPLPTILNLASKCFTHLGHPRMVWCTVLGTWWGRPFCTAQRWVIESLITKGLIHLQKERDQKFYILNTRKEHRRFFKELEMQIALGSIQLPS